MSEPIAPINEHVLTCLELCSDVVQSDYRRDIERTRQNRGVRRAATQIRRDPKHVCPVNAGRIRRS